MIYSIKGKICEQGSDFLIINTGALSYQIFVSDFLLEKTDTNQEIQLFTYLEVRENISGIGPKSAINVLSLINVSDLEKAIISGKEDILTKVSGIGKKTAQRIILELKEKILKSGISQDVIDKDDTLVIDALVNMDYSPAQARQIIKKIPLEIKGIKERIKYALKMLSKK